MTFDKALQVAAALALVATLAVVAVGLATLWAIEQSKIRAECYRSQSGPCDPESKAEKIIRRVLLGAEGGET